MREKDLINPKQCLLVINKKLKKIALVLVGEIGDLDSILGQFSKFQKTLLKLSGFFGIILNLLVLLLIHDFVFESSLHDTFTNFFNALYKEAFELILLANLINLLKTCLFIPLPFLINHDSEVFNGLIVVCLQELDIFEYLFFNIIPIHLRLVDEVNEALEF